MTERRVVVIGAGVGGLSAAIRLAAQGVRVTLIEAAATPGGKMREVEHCAARIDAGPTILTMRHVFEDLFHQAGETLADHVTLTPLKILARHAWDDRQRLDLYADRQQSADAIGAFAGADAARGYLDFCQRAGQIYKTLSAPFIEASRPNLVSLISRIGFANVSDIRRITPYQSLWNALATHFKDPRLHQLFGRYATYCGSSPFSAPATLMLVAHVEQDGVWSVDGGMYQLTCALAALAEKLGVDIQYDTRVDRILVTAGRASGVITDSGARFAADAIVCNGDVSSFAAGLFGSELANAVRATPPKGRSLSAITWGLTTRTSGFPLTRHNVFFSNAYKSEFDDIFKNARLPRSPTVYVCAQNRLDEQLADNKADRLLVLVNAPATNESDAQDEALSIAEIERCQAATIRLLSHCGLSLDQPLESAQRTSPQDFAALFPASGGALYGRASHGWMASFARPGSRTRVPGLYLAGGSAHPGPGVPMAALSGRQAAQSVMADLTSASPSRRSLMRGGMLTR